MEPDILHKIPPFGQKILQPCWYAVYTRPHYEKKVYKQLQQENIEAYLPLQMTIKQWSDRRKKVCEPLFSRYLFVSVSTKEYYTVLNIAGVARYITFEGKAVSIPAQQIQHIKNILELNIEATETIDNLPVGVKVEIMTGPLMGIVGELIEYAGKKRVIVHIKEICKSILINVPLNYLKLAE